MADPVNAVTQVLAQISQNMGQMNAHLRSAGDVAGNAISGFYSEAKRYMRAFDEQRGMRYRPAAITIAATLTPGAGTIAAGSADFRVAQNEDFLVQSVRGFVILNNIPAEPDLVTLPNISYENAAGAFMLTPLDRLIAKANNCRVTILNKDTKVPITENESIPLSSICPEAGGEIMKFGPDGVPGFIIAHNQTMQAQFALQSANLMFNTASTSYGIILCGLYMSREVR